MSAEILEAIDAEIDSLGAELARLTEQLEAGRRRTEALSMTRELVEGFDNGRLEELHGELEGLIGLAAPGKPDAVKPPPEERKPPAKPKAKGGRKKVAATATPQKGKAGSEGAAKRWAEKHAGIDEKVFAGVRELGEPSRLSAIRRAVTSEISTTALKSSLKRLVDGDRVATSGHGAGTRYAAPGVEARPAPPAKDEPDPPMPTQKEREQRSLTQGEEKSQLLRLIHECGGVTPAEVAGYIGISEEEAQRRLIALARSTSVKKVGKKYSVQQVPGDVDGAKTAPERRIVAAIREAGDSIDEGTLAFATQMSINDLRNYVPALVRRHVLLKRELDGVTLYELPGRPNL